MNPNLASESVNPDLEDENLGRTSNPSTWERENL